MHNWISDNKCCEQDEMLLASRSPNRLVIRVRIAVLLFYCCEADNWQWEYDISVGKTRVSHRQTTISRDLLYKTVIRAIIGCHDAILLRMCSANCITSHAVVLVCRIITQHHILFVSLRQRQQPSSFACPFKATTVNWSFMRYMAWMAVHTALFFHNFTYRSLIIVDRQAVTLSISQQCCRVGWS